MNYAFAKIMEGHDDSVEVNDKRMMFSAAAVQAALAKTQAAQATEPTESTDKADK